MDSRANQKPATSLSPVVPRAEPEPRFKHLRPRVKDFWRRAENRLARLTSDRRRVGVYRALTPVRLIWAYLYDARRFSRAAHLTNAFKNRRTAGAHLLRGAHALEKGQALPAPRPGFGAAKIRELLSDAARYHEQFGCDEVSFAVVGVLRGTQRFHERTGHPWGEWETALKALENTESRIGGNTATAIDSLPLTRAEVLAALPADPEAFFRRRCSVRQFAPGPIDRATLERAVLLAQKTPSVCNRQSARVHIYTDPGEMRAVLKHQDGNAGFGHEVGVVMVITSDLSCFYKEGERNQGFVDGGLFAMSLVYALHSLGLGSCLLNWSRGPHDDAKLRREIRLPDNEIIITLLAAGHLQETFTVAASPRRPLADVLEWGSLKDTRK